MPKDFNLGLVFLSYLVAVTASHVTLLLAARVRDPHATNWKLWVVSGGFAMGIGIWSMHFVATLALKLPIRVLYDLSLTALSWVFAGSGSNCAPCAPPPSAGQTLALDGVPTASVSSVKPATEPAALMPYAACCVLPSSCVGTHVLPDGFQKTAIELLCVVSWP